MRAYTYIDRGSARVGNSFLERSWSTFLGVTLSIRDRGTGWEWLSRKTTSDSAPHTQGLPLTGDEFLLSSTNAMFRPFDFGYVEWSEENNLSGAVLSACWTGSQVDVVMRAFAFHEHPGVVRTLSIKNKSSETLGLEQSLFESFSIRKDILTTMEPLPQITLPTSWETPKCGVIATSGNRGILVAAAGKGHMLLENNTYGASHNEIIELAPGTLLSFPPTFLFAYPAPFNLAAKSLYLDLLKAWGEIEILRVREQ